MSRDDKHFPIVDWEDVARVQIHPRRFGLLQVLSIDGNRTLSPSECAYELRTNIADVHYHMNVLVGAGLVRQAHVIPVRGVEEHFYCLTGHSADDLFERLDFPRGMGRGKLEATGVKGRSPPMPSSAPVASIAFSLARLDDRKQGQRLGAVDGLHQLHLLPKSRLRVRPHSG